MFLVIGGKRIDIARFIEPQYIWDQGDDYKSYIQWINKVSPVPMAGEVDSDTRAHKFFPQFADPILGPVFQVAFDMDFRLRSIQDPNAGPWGADPNLTSDERMFNIASYLGRSYGGQYAALVADLYNGYQGLPDRYGRHKTMSDALVNVFVKIQRFDDR